MQSHQQGQDDLTADARNRQQALGFSLQLRMLLQVLRQRFLDLAQGILQGGDDLSQTLTHGRRDAGATGHLLQSVFFLLQHLFQVLPALEQAIEFAHFVRQRCLGGGLASGPIARQQQGILPVRFGTPAHTFGPVAHMPRIWAG